jgi:hypothetical protein
MGPVKGEEERRESNGGKYDQRTISASMKMSQ